jgi:hypothetical protein
MKSRCCSGTSALAGEFRHEALHVRNDAVSRGRVAVAHRWHVPLIDALAPRRSDVAAEANDMCRGIEIVERDGTWTIRRRAEPIAGEQPVPRQKPVWQTSR